MCLSLFHKIVSCSFSRTLYLTKKHWGRSAAISSKVFTPSINVFYGFFSNPLHFCRRAAYLATLKVIGCLKTRVEISFWTIRSPPPVIVYETRTKSGIICCTWKRHLTYPFFIKKIRFFIKWNHSTIIAYYVSICDLKQAGLVTWIIQFAGSVLRDWLIFKLQHRLAQN